MKEQRKTQKVVVLGKGNNMVIEIICNRSSMYSALLRNHYMGLNRAEDKVRFATHLD